MILHYYYYYYYCITRKYLVNCKNYEVPLYAVFSGLLLRHFLSCAQIFSSTLWWHTQVSCFIKNRDGTNRTANLPQHELREQCARRFYSMRTSCWIFSVIKKKHNSVSFLILNFSWGRSHYCLLMHSCQL